MDGTTLGTAYVQVVPSTEGISGELSSAFDSAGEEAGRSSGQKFGSSFGGAMGTAMKAGGMAVGAVTAGVTVLGGAFAKSAGSVAAHGDEIEKTAQKMGFSFQGYQEWDQIMQHNGSSIKGVRTAMVTLSKQAEKNSDAFEKLGITEEELATMNQEELFERVIQGLQDMGEGTERTELATQLLGRGAKELGPLLNMTSEETEQLRQRTHELGGIMSDEAVKSAAQYEDSLQDMNFAIEGVKNKVMVEFLPSMTGVFNGIAELFSGDSEKGIGMIKDGLTGFITKLTETIPKVIEAGTQILLALVKAITDNLPQIVKAGMDSVISLAQGIGDALPDLIPAVVDAVLTIVETLIDNIDVIIDAGVKLIIGLAEGLIKAIPKIIEKIPTIIEKLFNALIQAAPKIAEAGVQLLTSLVKNLPTIISGIVKALPEIIKNILTGIAGFVQSMAEAGVTLLTSIVQNLPEIIKNIVGKIPNIISGIVKGLKEGLSKIVEVGKDLITGLGKGLIEGAKKVIEKAKQVARDVLDAIKGFFGIASPSKVMMGVGGFLMEGLAEGISDAEGSVQSAMNDVNDMLLENTPDDPFGFMAGINADPYSAAGVDASMGAVRVIDGVQINVYGAVGQNVNDLADAVADRLQTLVDRKAAVWA